MTTAPTPVELDVHDGPLHALRWGDGPRVAVALHGITANAMSWGAVAARLPADWSLVSLDQRGRGRSRDLPGPYGVDDLARDARDVVRATGAEVLAGHSLGAYVALAVDHLHPGTVGRLVLVDGGVPLPVPAGLSEAELDGVLDATIGPMVERLRTTYPDIGTYVDFFRAHPAMGPYWSDDLEAYARYDAVETDDGVRASASEDAVRVAGRELLTRADTVRDAVAGLATPTHLLTAERGMFDEPQPFLPPDAVAEAQRAASGLRVTALPDTNHYTVLLGDDAAGAVAAAVAG